MAMDTSTRERARDDRQDNRRAFRWGAAAVAVLVAGALGYNLLSHERAGPLNPETPAAHQPAAPAPSAAGGNSGASGAAGPGTGAGTGTGDTTGTGAPRN